MENRRQNNQGSLIGGIILIAMGSMFLLDRMNLFNFDFGDWWPMFLIIPGIVMALDPNRKNKNGAFFMIAFGLIFQVAELNLFRWWRWRNLWPVMMIVIGVWMLLQHLSARETSQPSQISEPPPGQPFQQP